LLKRRFVRGCIKGVAKAPSRALLKFQGKRTNGKSVHKINEVGLCTREKKPTLRAEQKENKDRHGKHSGKNVESN